MVLGEMNPQVIAGCLLLVFLLTDGNSKYREFKISETQNPRKLKSGQLKMWEIKNFYVDCHFFTISLPRYPTNHMLTIQL